MDRSWLIQRLNKPREYEGKLKGLENAFSFGGGLVNGGLSKEAMELLNFDYMEVLSLNLEQYHRH